MAIYRDASAAMALRLDKVPWLHWLIVSTALIVYFFVFRCVAMSAMLELFGTPDERTNSHRASSIVLGFFEDVLLVTLLLVLLSLVDSWLGPRSTTERVWLRRSGRAFLHLVLVVVFITPFAADMLLIRSRGLRFTFEFITTYIREFKFTAGFEVEPREIRIARETTAISVVVAVALTVFGLRWLDYSRWHLAKLFIKEEAKRVYIPLDESDWSTDLEEGESSTSSEEEILVSSPPSDKPSDCATTAKGSSGAGDVLQRKISSSEKVPTSRRAFAIAVPAMAIITLSTVLLLITHAVPAVVSACALNDSLNELYRVLFDLQFLKSLGDGTIESAALYIDSTTESYELFKDDVLYRKTTGFKGPLAFDVAVDDTNPPNVLVLTVESFRYQDSLYLVGNKSEAILKKQGNLTLTPQFDRWAQRGVTFRNMWSAWQTSRSVEGILFGQVPYDHVSDSGTTTGRKKVKLNGIPQLFHAKGYETKFTTGARLDYDGWDKFFDVHGFDEVFGAADMRKYAEAHYNISKKDWEQPSDGGEGRAMYWGVHDDVSFEVLGDLLLNKTQEQQTRVQSGQPKQPFFINHYTISSHTPWEEHPSWYDEDATPDFSPLYAGRPSAGKIKNYAKMRYFTDMELGKFLDRMQAAGVLNDTIVIIVGDHGQSPESAPHRLYNDEVTTMRIPAALIAEGRLATYAGLIIDHAAGQHDLLNTIADIVGVPSGGFLQSGVGRSLKRAVPFGQHTVWTNNPMHHLGVVRGHKRLSYDRVFSMIALYAPEDDPELTTDLLPTVSEEERQMWLELRGQGRRLSRYFRVRWDNECISQVEC